MCISPIRIRNPNIGLTGWKGMFMKDTTSKQISVPCGHCYECIANKQMSLVQRILCESMVNHLFFCTLTYNNESLPILSTSTGFDIRFADISDVQKMFKRLRIRNAFGRPFRYFGVSELGSSRGRPHFHFLILLPKYDDDSFVDCLNLEKILFDNVLSEWKRNYGSDRNPIWKPLCTYVRKVIRGKIRSNFDLHYVNPVLSDGQEADVAFYCLKYLLKPSDRQIKLQQALHLNLPSDEYHKVWNIVKCRHFESEFFGLGQSVKDSDGKPVFHPKILSHLVDGVQRSKGNFDFPCFFNPCSGKTFPLCSYYKNFSEVLSMRDVLDFYYALKDGRVDNVIITPDNKLNGVDVRMYQFEKQRKIVDDYDSALELNELFD